MVLFTVLVAIQLNDTHPTSTIAEWMCLFVVVDSDGLDSH
jgi:hypothetical protein